MRREKALATRSTTGAKPAVTSGTATANASVATTIPAGRVAGTGVCSSTSPAHAEGLGIGGEPAAGVEASATGLHALDRDAAVGRPQPVEANENDAGVRTEPPEVVRERQVDEAARDG